MAYDFSGFNLDPNAFNVDPNNFSFQNLNNGGYGIGFADVGLSSAPAATPSLFSRGLDGLNKLGDGMAANQGALNFGIGAFKGIADAWSAWNTNKNQKDLLNFNKQQYANNLAMSKKAFNNSLEERQMRKVSANPNAEAVDSYMKKWGA